MTLNTIQIAGGVEKSLADWGISACRREVNNQASDHVSFDFQADANAVDPFPFGTMITLRVGRAPNQVNPFGPGKPPTLALNPGLTFKGGLVFFVGWRISAERVATPDAQVIRYKFGGPWDFFLDRLVFQKLFLTWNGTKDIADWRSQIVLGQSLTDLTGPNDTIPGSIATTRLSLSQQIREIVNYCINQTTTEYGSPQFQFDPLTMVGGLYPLSSAPGTFCKIPDYVPGLGTGLSGNGYAPGQTTQALEAPLEAVQDITCGEALRRQLQWIGGMGSPVAWFDYTQTPPALNISTRDQLTAKNLPAFLAGSKELNLQRRDDLIPSAVCYKFRVQTTGGGVTVTFVYDDVATPIGCTNEATGVTDSSLLPYRTKIAADVKTLDFEGPVSTSQTSVIGCVALDLGDPSTDSTALTCWQKLYPSFNNVTSLTLTTAATVTDPVSGATVSLSPYSYVLLNGGVADWMTTGSTPGAQAKVRIRATFSFVDSVGQVVANHDVNLDAIVTNLPSGTYTGGSLESAGEEIPWGLASYVYNIEKIPQYQGTFTILECDNAFQPTITDQCPMGNNLNLTGSLAEWATMNACVQNIVYDLDAGSTTITVGPAPHLGAQDLVERLRVNRPPRALYLIGYNLLND